MPVGRRQRKKEELRARILDAASQLIARQGLAATTVDQIAELADISQTTFFNYFRNKAHLVDALVARMVRFFDDTVDRVHGVDASAVQKVETLFQLAVDLTEGQHRFVRDLIGETARSSTLEARISFEHMRAVLTEDLAQSQARGEVRRDQSAQDLADAVLGLYVSAFLFWTTDASYSVAERLRTSALLATDLIEQRG
ncbi:MAG TPA: TetR/AcrR family transcriptional regulator [Acidimicrobiales bacterium]|jgi:AcrR family transcriptional regulator